MRTVATARGENQDTSLKIRGEVSKDRPWLRPLKKAGRVLGGPFLGRQDVLDLQAKAAFLAEGGELISPAEIHARHRGRINTVVDACRRGAEMGGRHIQR